MRGGQGSTRAYTHFELAAVARGLLLALLGSIAVPERAHSQIVALAEEQGRTIYVNANVPEHRSVPRGLPDNGDLSEAAPAASPPFDRLVRETARRAQVDPQLVHAIIQVESEYNPHAYSRKGAMGLMQLLPPTARRLGVGNPFDPEENVAGGVAYLKYLLDLFGGDVPLSLAAYNSGENAILRARGIPPSVETQSYVRRVTDVYRRANGTAGDPRPTPRYSPPIHRYVDASGVTHFAQ